MELKNRKWVLKWSCATVFLTDLFQQKGRGTTTPDSSVPLVYGSLFYERVGESLDGLLALLKLGRRYLYFFYFLFQGGKFLID